ncbi:MAG: hypothetical protein ACOX5R_21310 [bacterium]|jgi:hypothetical protein
MTIRDTEKSQPGVCIPWQTRIEEYDGLPGDEDIVKKAWEDMDQLAYLYIWFCLIQF